MSTAELRHGRARDCVMVIALCAATVTAWTPRARAGEMTSARGTDTAVLPKAPVETGPRDLTTREVLTLTGVGAGLSTLVVVGGTLAWWRDEPYVGWNWRNTGFFGGTTYAGGSDKMGHAFAWWIGVRASTQVFQWFGISRRHSLMAGTTLSLVLGNVVEVGDAFTRYGFEWPDVVANVTGAGAALAAELWPAFDELFGFRMSYVPSPRFRAGEKNYIKLVNDYDGMMFLLDLKLAGLEPAFGVSPGFWRYLNVGLSYGTRGYSPKELPKQRVLGVQASLNVPEILDAIFGKDGKAVAVATTLTRYIAIPFTGIASTYGLNYRQRAVSFGVANRYQIE